MPPLANFKYGKYCATFIVSKSDRPRAFEDLGNRRCVLFIYITKIWNFTPFARKTRIFCIKLIVKILTKLRDFVRANYFCSTIRPLRIAFDFCDRIDTLSNVSHLLHVRFVLVCCCVVWMYFRSDSWRENLRANSSARVCRSTVCRLLFTLLTEIPRRQFSMCDTYISRKSRPSSNIWKPARDYSFFNRVKSGRI